MAQSDRDFFAGNVERFSGFADVYDRYRPEPPAILADVLTRLAGEDVPRLVVDLGSGTGLSTRYWAARAHSVTGIEPSADMRWQAEQQTRGANVSYREGFSHATGLADGCASIVTCSQSLHWMDPQATFVEARRILRPGGIFAAYDYDWPPTTGCWEADKAYADCFTRMMAVEDKRKNASPVRRWEKEGHLARMAASGVFAFTKEVVLHHIDSGNAERLYGLALSQGGVISLLKGGFSEADLGLDVLKSVLARTLGDTPQPWYWSSRLRIGVKEKPV